jgi:HD-like signal output (HDOD) protein/GGDEF domain-containing protein
MTDEPAAASILDRVVSRTRRLYSLPAVAARVLELTSQDQVDPREIKACIENDPALTATILRVANSSLFGLRTEVKNLHQAIGLLGVRSLKMLVLGFSLPGELSRDVDPAVLERFWRHTVYRAVAARGFAQRLWQISGDDAFIAGLLGGIGMLALIQDLGETYTQFLDHVYEQGGDLSEQELAVLGFDHAVLAAKMLEHWGLPPALVTAVRRPRQLPQVLALPANEQPLAAALLLAELAAEFLVTGQPGRLQTLLTTATRLKNLSAEEVQQAIDELEKEAQQLADPFQVVPPEKGAFGRMFEQAHARLAELSESALLSGDRAIEDVLLSQVAGMQQELGRAVSAAARRPDGAPGLLRRGDAPRTGQRAPLVRPPVRVGGETALSTRAVITIERCRSQRCPLSLVLATVDNFSEVLIDLGPEQAEELVRWLGHQCRMLGGEGENIVAIGEARIGLLIEDCDRLAAAAFAWRLLDAARRHMREALCGTTRPIKVSVGVATVALPPRNFSERQLIDAARRCLQAAQTSGGDTVKSIEI